MGGTENMEEAVSTGGTISCMSLDICCLMGVRNQRGVRLQECDDFKEGSRYEYDPLRTR
jgi:hypothetical protein